MFVNIVFGDAGDRWSRGAHEDTAALVAAALEDLGLATTFDEPLGPGRLNILFGYHKLRDAEAVCRTDFILYQLEHLLHQEWDLLALDAAETMLLRSAKQVWEFSRLNIPVLEAAGVGAIRHVPIGYHPALERVRDAEPDIDVLFYGAVNGRRKRVLDALRRHCRVRIVLGVYGERRDELIGRSKIVLNLRQFAKTSIMEQPRVSFLMTNRRFVVTEEADENPYGDAVVAVPYDDLVECCLRYLEDETGRRRMADRGYEFISSRPMSKLIGDALATL